MEDPPESSSPSSSLSSSFSSSSLPNPHPLSIDVELWLMAERRTQEILFTIQPALVSDQRRKGVIDYIQRLIKCYYGTEVLPFGSVPLKTYLPDGDIDLTALSHQNAEDLAKDVCSILEGKGQDFEFQVKDVQYIRAQVQIVKCTVNNIAVDISFNQMAGLSALCFMEKVDKLIGKDHLFKSSIILIKAWCYYESRILCAHHGLISTYALETLVLYIINLFHSSLCGPLAVLYRFLDYYSTFDWDNYCVTVNGPVAITSFPKVVVISENEGDELLLGQEFMKNCRETFSVPMKALEGQEFPIKHLNIMDPLKDNNNLGRSVSKGNFHRIRCALSYGAQRLGEILVLPGESMGMGLEKFFKNTLDRNGRGQRPDVQVPVPAFGTGRSVVSDLCGDCDNYYCGLLYGQWYQSHTLPVSAQPSPPSSPSQVQNRNAWDALRHWVECKRNVFYRRGTDVYVPTLTLPLRHPYAATFSIDERVKSRGTGTYIPDASNLSYREQWVKSRSPASVTRGLSPKSVTCDLSPKSPQKTDRVEDPTETEKGGNGSCLDLSLEEFPLLPDSKKPIPSENYQSGKRTVESTQAKDCSPCLGIIEFGTFERSPSPLAMEKEQELLETDEERVLLKPYQLEDDKEFPPLAS